jgi:23S rRNA (cytosine1962-C5)-methyltransferase
LRRPLLDGGTDAFRLVDRGRFGPWALDDFAGRWLVQTWRGEPPAWLPDAAEALGADALYWKRLGDKSPPQWLRGEPVAGRFEIRENGLRHLVDFDAGTSQGLFLDQRLNRDRVRARADGARILNSFAYTCGFGVAAAAGGGITTNIDLSRPYLEWGKENFVRNEIPSDRHEFLKGDTFDWMRRFKKKGRLFDGIILDPPTFSRDHDGKIFTVEGRFGELVAAAAALLAPGGWMLGTTNQESLSEAGFERLALSGLPDRHAWRVESRPMPPEYTGPRYLKTLWITRRLAG